MATEQSRPRRLAGLQYDQFSDVDTVFTHSLTRLFSPPTVRRLGDLRAVSPVINVQWREILAS